MSILIPLAPFIMPVLIVAIIFYFTSRNRQSVHETVREAIRQGQTLDAETVKALGMPQKKKGGDIRAGAILLAIAAALVVFGVMFNMASAWAEPEFPYVMTAIAAFPGLIGLVLIGFGIANSKRDKED